MLAGVALIIALNNLSEYAFGFDHWPLPCIALCMSPLFVLSLDKSILEEQWPSVCVCPWEVNVNLMGKISSNVLVQCRTVCVGRGTNTAGQNTSGYMCLMLNYSTSNYMHSTPCSIPL